MPISTELLNTTYANLVGPLRNAFVVNNFLWDALKQKSSVVIDGGTLIERTIAGGAPARGVGGFSGDELLNLGRRQRTRRYQVEPHRLMAAISIPEKELDMNDGKAAVIRLIKEYPVTFMEATIRDINAYMLTGTSTGLAFATAELVGLTCLNGQFATGRGTGVLNGLLDFAAPAAQTDVVQNVTKSDAIFHFNQFFNITAWATDGMRILRQAYRRGAQFSGKRNGGPDIVVMDDDVYSNWEESRLGIVRLRATEDRTEKSNMLSLYFGLAMAHPEIDLNRGSFAAGVPGADPTQGVTYMVNSDNAELVLTTQPKVDQFQDRTADQQVAVAKFAAQGNTIFNKFPSHVAVTGGAV